MILHAHECRARANEARELARQVKRASTKTALEQAAEYWFALAERVEQQEGALHLPPPFASHVDGLPVFRYLVSVGTALISGIAGRECAIRVTSLERGSGLQGSNQRGAALG